MMARITSKTIEILLDRFLTGFFLVFFCTMFQYIEKPRLMKAGFFKKIKLITWVE